MDTLKLVFDASWHVLVAGLLLGAGLPTLFALGVRAGAGAADEVRPDGTVVSHPPRLGGRALAGLCFSVVLFGVVIGIMVIVGAGFGMEVTFENFFPTLAPKE
jgi:hypothetical protein